jgi:hypothetical protein
MMTCDEVLAFWAAKDEYKYIPCGSQFGRSAGESVRCTRHQHNKETKHYNHELSVSWW